MRSALSFSCLSTSYVNSYKNLKETGVSIVEAEIEMGEKVSLYEIPMNQSVEIYVRIKGFNWSKGKIISFSPLFENIKTLKCCI